MRILIYDIVAMFILMKNGKHSKSDYLKVGKQGGMKLGGFGSAPLNFMPLDFMRP